MLNEYFTEMVDVVFKHSGILDKYIGDAIMALFGAPFPGPRGCEQRHARRQRHDRRRCARSTRRSWRAGKRPIDIGVGLNTGDVVVGSIGSPKRMEYTAIGDSVNLASRLESACKTYGVKVILSEFTVRQLTEPMARAGARPDAGEGQAAAGGDLRGARSPHAGDFPEHGRDPGAFRRGLAAYRQRDWGRGADALEAALALSPHDAPSRIYRDRCVHFAANPPENDWDGVWVLKEK